MPKHIDITESTGYIGIVSKPPRRKMLFHATRDPIKFRTLCGRYDINSAWVPEHDDLPLPTPESVCKVCAGMLEGTWGHNG